MLLIALAQPPATAPPVTLRVNVKPGTQLRQRVIARFWGEGPQGEEAGEVEFTTDMHMKVLSQNSGYTRWSQQFSTSVQTAKGPLANMADVFTGMNGFRLVRVTDPLNRTIKLETSAGTPVNTQSSFEVRLPRNPVQVGSSWSIPLTMGNTKTSVTFTYRGTTQGMHRVELKYAAPLEMPEGPGVFLLDPADGLPRYGRAVFGFPLPTSPQNMLMTRYELDRGAKPPAGLLSGKDQ